MAGSSRPNLALSASETWPVLAAGAWLAAGGVFLLYLGGVFLPSREHRKCRPHSNLLPLGHEQRGSGGEQGGRDRAFR